MTMRSLLRTMSRAGSTLLKTFHSIREPFERSISRSKIRKMLKGARCGMERSVFPISRPLLLSCRTTETARKRFAGAEHFSLSANKWRQETASGKINPIDSRRSEAGSAGGRPLLLRPVRLSGKAPGKVDTELRTENGEGKSRGPAHPEFPWYESNPLSDPAD